MSDSPAKTTDAGIDARAAGFKAVFDTIVGGFSQASTIADRGAGYTLLTTGVVILAFAMAMRFFSGAADTFTRTVGVEGSVAFSGDDFTISLIVGLLTLAAGALVRTFDTYINFKEVSQERELRIRAAQKTQELITGVHTAAVSTDDGGKSQRPHKS